jgi:chemotaxis regulatin CheY-phosphate phosphatase CheZ
MTVEEKLEAITDNLDRLTQVVNTLAVTAATHDDQIEALIAVGERHEAQIQSLVREWQAYLRTIRPQ